MNQYNTNKTQKLVLKVFVLSSASGFSYKFEFFTGTSDNVYPPNEPDLGASRNKAIRLAQNIPDTCNYKLYVDNWFNSIGLNICMYQRNR